MHFFIVLLILKAMAVFLFAFAVFIILHTFSADLTYKYNITSPSSPHFLMSVGKDKREIKVLIDTNRPYSMVFDKECSKKGFECTKNTHLYYYDAKLTGGKITNKTLTDRYDYNRNFGGFLFQDQIKFGSLEEMTEVLVVDHGHRGYDFEWDGVLGLGYSEEPSSIVGDLLTTVSSKQIIIQEGKYNIVKKDKTNENTSRGSIVFGRRRGSSKCGSFTYVNATEKSWYFKTDIQVGEKTLKNQTVGFVPGRPSQVPKEIFDEYFSDRKAKNESNFHDISFTIADRMYKISRNDYSSYSEAGDTYEPLIDIAYSDYGYDFAFGSDFLQHYCLMLKTDQSIQNFRIGFAENAGTRFYITHTSLFLIVVNILRLLM